MRKIALALLLTPILWTPFGFADETEDGEKFVHKSGLTVAIPSDWERESRQERGSTIFAALYSPTPKKYVLVRVEVGPADGFEAAKWLATEKAQLGKFLAETTTAFKAEEGATVGDLDATAYTMAGKVKPDGRDPYALRVRVRAVIHGRTFFRIIEYAYNNAEDVANDQIEAIWDGISFQEGGGDAESGDGGDAGGGMAPPAEGADGGVLEDKDGNFKITLPKGWSIIAQNDDPKGFQRAVAHRLGADGRVLVLLEFYRDVSSRGETFSIDTPGDVLSGYDKRGFFERFYGEGSAGTITPRVDQATLLGGAEKSAQFEYRGLSVKEIEKKREIEALIRRGDKKAKMPGYKDRVIRGRIALVSPNIYIVTAYFVNRSLADNEEMRAELKKVLDSYQYLETGAKPPPLNLGAGPLGNTVEDPKNAKDRKESFVHVSQSPRKAYKMAFKFVVPKGFARESKVSGPAITLVAQDKDNNWCRIFVFATSQAKLADERKQFADKKQVFEGWRSTWTSKARGVKMKTKPSKVSMGGSVRGPGYKMVEGRVENFKGTFTGVLIDKSGWRVTVEMETRGDHTVYEDQLKTFFKSLKFKKTK